MANFDCGMSIYDLGLLWNFEVRISDSAENQRVGSPGLVGPSGVLIDDGEKDDDISGDSQDVRIARPLVTVSETPCEPLIESEQPERDGKMEEQAVARFSPESDEERACEDEAKGDRAG